MKKIHLKYSLFEFVLYKSGGFTRKETIFIVGYVKFEYCTVFLLSYIFNTALL